MGGGQLPAPGPSAARSPRRGRGRVGSGPLPAGAGAGAQAGAWRVGVADPPSPRPSPPRAPPGALTGSRSAREPLGLRGALRPFSQPGRALPDSCGPGAGFGAHGQKGAAEPAAGSSGFGWALRLAGDAVPGTGTAWVAPDNARGSAELALPGKKLFLAPFFR